MAHEEARCGQSNAGSQSGARQSVETGSLLFLFLFADCCVFAFLVSVLLVWVAVAVAGEVKAPEMAQRKTPLAARNFKLGDRLGIFNQTL